MPNSTTYIGTSLDGSPISRAGESFMKLLKTKAFVNLMPMFTFCPCVSLVRQQASILVLLFFDSEIT